MIDQATGREEAERIDAHVRKSGVGWRHDGLKREDLQVAVRLQEMA